MTQAPVQSLPWPDEALSYAALPASGDDGFPQALRQQQHGLVDLLAQVVRHPDVELQLHLGRCHFVQASCRNVIRGLDDLIPRLRRFD